MATSETPISGSNSVNPGATTETVCYTSPTAGGGSVLSSIVVCNQGAAAATYRIGVSPGGGALVAAEYLVYDDIMDGTTDGDNSLMMTVGITMAADDEVRVEASTANFSFSVFGMELGA